MFLFIFHTFWRNLHFLNINKQKIKSPGNRDFVIIRRAVFQARVNTIQTHRKGSFFLLPLQFFHLKKQGQGLYSGAEQEFSKERHLRSEEP